MEPPNSGADQIPINPPASVLGVENAILHGRGRQHYHVDFEGPLSIKAVVQGEGRWETAAGRFTVAPGRFLVLDAGRKYTITIAAERPVETFCVFFKPGFVEEAARVAGTSASRLLDNPEPACVQPVHFPEILFGEVLFGMENRVLPLIGVMRDAVARGEAAREDQLAAVVTELANLESRVTLEMSKLPALRQSTRDELYRRLQRGRSFLEESLEGSPPLTAIAREAALSPFHFHRLFAQMFGETPGQYAQRRKLDRAANLLATTDLPVTDVCLESGFSSRGSFSTVFRKRFGKPPGAFRDAARKKAR